MKKPALISDFLHRIKRPMQLDPTSRYMLVTIKLYHKGVVLREEKMGADIKSNMYQVKKGDFILSGIDARNGAFGIVPPELDGAVVTNDFWYFDIDEEVVNKSFFLELTATHWFDEICRKGSDGTTQRIRLQKDKFFNQTIFLPDLTEQWLFNKQFQVIKASNKTLTSELTHQKTLLKKLRQQILQEAIEGKLTTDWRKQNPNIEPANELLKRITIEKMQLAKDKKIKAQKPLQPITDEEKLFELPPGWVWCRLGDLGIITRGKGPKYDETSNVKILNQKCVRWFYVDIQHCKTINKKWFESLSEENITFPNDILVNSTGEGTIGRAAIVAGNAIGLPFDSHVLKFRGMVSPNYIVSLINSEFGQFQINKLKGAKSTKQTELGASKLSSLIFPVPSEDEVKVIVAKVEKLLSICDKLEIQIIQNQAHSEQLMQSVLQKAFSKNQAETKKSSAVIPFKPKGSDYYKRTLLAAEIVCQLKNEPTLGHLKLQKLIYLCQKSENMQLPVNFLQQAAGPYDPKMARSLDKQLQDKGWFQFQKSELLKYKPLPNVGTHKPDFQKYFSTVQTGIQTMIDLFRNTKSDHIEIVATLYACWEKMIENKEPFSTETLIRQFYAWSKEKSRFSEEVLKNTILWMSDKDVFPKQI